MRIFIFVLAVVSTSASMAQGIDAASQEALMKTIQLLQSQKERQKFIDQNEAAADADQKVKALGNGAQQQRIYELATQVFQDMVNRTGGDPEKMKDLLKQSPESFAESFSPEQKKILRELAQDIEASSAPKRD